MAIAAVFLPLIAAIVVGLFGRSLGDRASQLITCICVGIAALCAIVNFYDVAVLGHAQSIQLMTWIDTGPLSVDWALRLDTLSAVMVAVVTVVSCMVHIYSIGYMS